MLLVNLEHKRDKHEPSRSTRNIREINYLSLLVNNKLNGDKEIISTFIVAGQLTYGRKINYSVAGQQDSQKEINQLQLQVKQEH